MQNADQRQLLAAAVVLACAVAIWRAAQALSLQSGFDPAHQHVVFAVLLGPFVFALIALALRWHGRGLRWLGLAREGAARAAATGLLAYLLPAGLALAACLAAGVLSISAQAPLGELLSGIAMIAVLVLLGEALPEELLFRGYLWAGLSGVLSTWQVVAAQAVLFVVAAAAMGAVANPLDASFLLCFAVVLGLLRAATASLWAPIAFHLAFMVVQQSMGSSRNLFAVDRPELMQMMMAMLPFSIAIIAFHRRVAWTARPTPGTPGTSQQG
ncbi:MAG: hypothetical protein DI564_15375 [Rhodanobacter denitrificans]|uniref:CAAX prenyl protease 2/Lysostaphin resistance protein A-like domain-containing protein n=1 Tax=Rhodanobacter denitrificans TaxID=666685 RepID=A0A2W5K1R8_9GAMM|nr:MAG: hypothetical protein DI564_15375 [Rhodanobacter denitrificans]